jgi:hypothetical protein
MSLVLISALRWIMSPERRRLFNSRTLWQFFLSTFWETKIQEFVQLHPSWNRQAQSAVKWNGFWSRDKVSRIPRNRPMNLLIFWEHCIIWFWMWTVPTAELARSWATICFRLVRNLCHSRMMSQFLLSEWDISYFETASPEPAFTFCRFAPRTPHLEASRSSRESEKWCQLSESKRIQISQGDFLWNRICHIGLQRKFDTDPHSKWCKKEKSLCTMIVSRDVPLSMDPRKTPALASTVIRNLESFILPGGYSLT